MDDNNETKRKVGRPKGFTASEVTRQRISESMKGRTAWNKGLSTKPMTEEAKAKLRATRRTRKMNNE